MRPFSCRRFLVDIRQRVYHEVYTVELSTPRRSPDPGRSDCSHPAKAAWLRSFARMARSHRIARDHQTCRSPAPGAKQLRSSSRVCGAAAIRREVMAPTGTRGIIAPVGTPTRGEAIAAIQQSLRRGCHSPRGHGSHRIARDHLTCRSPDPGRSDVAIRHNRRHGRSTASALAQGACVIHRHPG